MSSQVPATSRDAADDPALEAKPTGPPRSAAQWWRRIDRVSLIWMVVVAAVYVTTTFVTAADRHGWTVDRAMNIAVNMLHLRLDSGLPPGSLDTVTVGSATYQVISPLPIVPYLAFAPFPALWGPARWIIPTVLGIVAGWLALPLARRYGAPEGAAPWIAVLGAFGTLLWTQATSGNFYYLAHVEAILFTFVALLEWQGRRRPWVIGLGIALAAFARPTVLLAAVPFGAAFLLAGPRRWRSSISFAAPIALAIGATGLYNAVRFGSPLETGYAISVLQRADLIAARAAGVFSIRHIPNNLGLLIFRGFDLQPGFPYLAADPNGQSILLTSPGLLAAVSAGIRTRTPQLLWASSVLVAIPLLLYYGGGGFRTYGYRYALDFMPFLLALVAIGARQHFGALERLLVVASVGFVALGVLYQVQS